MDILSVIRFHVDSLRLVASCFLFFLAPSCAGGDSWLLPEGAFVDDSFIVLDGQAICVVGSSVSAIA